MSAPPYVRIPFGRDADGFARGGEQGAGLVAFALFGGRVAVGDDAGAGLDVHHAVLEHAVRSTMQLSTEPSGAK
jgi:hypothetical protein